MLGDYAGGGLVGFAGVLLAIIHRAVSGNGQVVEANMVDGVGYLGTIPRLRSKEPVWNGERGTNLLDGGCPYYRCYECKDAGKYISVGALEPQFFAHLLRGLDLSIEDVTSDKRRREDKAGWPAMHRLFEKRFRKKTRKEWEAVFVGLDACVTPVLDHAELEKAGYEQRPLVHLPNSPAKPVLHAWKGMGMPGDGGRRTLDQWFGWQKGKDYDIGTDGVFMALEKSKL